MSYYLDPVAFFASVGSIGAENRERKRIKRFFEGKNFSYVLFLSFLYPCPIVLRSHPCPILSQFSAHVYSQGSLFLMSHFLFQRLPKVRGHLPRHVPPRVGLGPVPRLCAHVPRTSLQSSRGRSKKADGAFWPCPRILLPGGYQETLLRYKERTHEGL